MGTTSSHNLTIINGSRYTVFVGLHGKIFDFRKEGTGEINKTISARITNGSFIEIYPAQKYLEMDIECKDQEDRAVKQLRFYSRSDSAWIVRNFGVARPKSGLVSLIIDEDYSNDASSNYKELSGNWKYDYGEKIRFYFWDIDRETLLAQRDHEDRDILEAMREAEKAYGEHKNWSVLSRAAHPKGFTKPTNVQKQICQEFIASCQIYTATMTAKVPHVWLKYGDVESLKKEKDLGSWKIEIQGLDNVSDNLQFERIVLASDNHAFATIHIHRGPIFTIHRIQECFTDSLVNQTEVWVTDPPMDLRQQDHGNRNFQVYIDSDGCKCWVSSKKKL